MYCGASSLENSLLLLREESLLQSFPILVCKGSRMLQHRLGGWLWNNRSRLSHSAGDQKSKPKCWQGVFLPRAVKESFVPDLFPWFVDGSLHMAFSVCESVFKSPPLFISILVILDSGPPPWLHFNLIKTLISNDITFWGTVSEDSSYKCGWGDPVWPIILTNSLDSLFISFFSQKRLKIKIQSHSDIFYLSHKWSLVTKYKNTYLSPATTELG